MCYNTRLFKLVLTVLFILPLMLPCFSDKPKCSVQVALSGDSGSEPQQPGEAPPQLFLWPPAL